MIGGANGIHGEQSTGIRTYCSKELSLPQAEVAALSFFQAGEAASSWMAQLRGRNACRGRLL